VLDLVFILVGFYLLAYIRLVAHEVSHLITALLVGCEPTKIVMGGNRLTFWVRNIEVHMGPSIFHGFVSNIVGSNTTRKMLGLIYLAGPVCDFILVPSLAVLAFFLLPYWLSIGVAVSAVMCLGSTVESLFVKDGDLFQFKRLTFSQS
jgi:hypothetical protein